MEAVNNVYVFLEDEKSLQSFRKDLRSCFVSGKPLNSLQENYPFYPIFNSIEELLQDAKSEDSRRWVLEIYPEYCFYVLEFDEATGKEKGVDKYYIDIAFRKEDKQ